ncbi:MAG TPA: gluconate 2-dehydrogenase subunit 3 family protein, partial [Roseiflexaceae bacterium]|nr:gluconate 2-dehydrogenase subunit 3 family protein [Roseiflexaceae bacterium]
RRHTMEGMFSDPAYGGNRDYVGWKLIGYPGAQRAYTVAELQGEMQPRTPQGLHELNHFNPGQEGREGVVLPLSGSNPNTWTEAHDAPGRSNHDQGR